jgi:hypothetical protein
MQRRSKKALLSALLLQLSFGVFAQGIDTFYYHPDSPVSLGSGVTKNFPLTQHRRCIERPPTDANGNVSVPIDSNGATSVKFYIDFAKDTKELHDTLNLAGQINAHIKFGKIFNPGLGLETKTSKSYSLNETSVALVIKAEADYGRYEYSDYTLKQEFEQMLMAEEHDRFARICGTHYVIRERRVGLVSAIIKVEDLSEEEKRELSASLTLGELPPPPYDPNDPWLPLPDPILPDPILPDPNPILPDPIDPNPIPIPDPIDFPIGDDPNIGGPIDLDLMSRSMDFLPLQNDPIATKKYNGMRIGIDQFLKKAVKTGKKVSVEFFATGGKGLSSLSQFVTDFSLKGIQMGLGEYLQNFTNDTTVPLKYTLASFELFGLQPDEREVNNALLSKIYYDYIEAEANYEKVVNHISTLTANQDATERRYFYGKKGELEAYMQKIWKLSKKILSYEEVEFSEMPERILIGWGKFVPQVSNLSNVFMCTSTAGTPCGTKKNLWKPTPFWSAGFEFAGKLNLVNKVKRISLYQRNSLGVKKVMMSVKAGNQYPDRSLKPTGEFEFKLPKYTQKENRQAYVEMINSGKLPSFTIGIEFKNGQERFIDLEQSRLVGNHSKHKTRR